MFKLLIKVITFLSVILCLTGVVQAVPIASLNVLDSNIHVGDSFNIEVLVDGDSIGLELLSFGFDVNTTGSVFTYDSYIIESGFDDDSIFVPLDVAGTAFPGISDDNVLLATLGFTAIGTGTGSLQTLGIVDNLFSGLAYEVDPITMGWHDINTSLDITINSVAAAPAPFIVFLLGIGMIWLSNKSRYHDL